MREYIEEDTGIPIAGYKRVWNTAIKEAIIANLTDNQIRGILYHALQCYDITAEERAQIEKILDLR